MTIFNAALNYPFANTEATRIAFAERGAEDVVAEQLKAANEQSFKVGSTITARYEFRVGEDGQLKPTATQITTSVGKPTDDSSGRKRNGLRYDEDRKPSFADLLKPKAELSPTDEVSLFADIKQIFPSTTSPVATNGSIASEPPRTEATDENGDKVEVEILTSKGEAVGNAANSSSQNVRAQFFAANLYARNANAFFTDRPVTQVAA